MGDTKRLLFVYGTFLKGEPGHRRLSGARLVKAARTVPRYRLLDLGAYPALVPGGETAVEGEVYAVDGPTLERLDRFEGAPNLFERTTIELEGGDRVLAYVGHLEQLDARWPIESGSWRKRAGGSRVRGRDSSPPAE